MQKLYCYVDETGQDTEGDFFLVAVLITSQPAVQTLEKQLEKIEQASAKQALKWHKTAFPRRQAYIQRITKLAELKNSIVYNVFKQTTDYTALTAQTLIQGIRAQAASPYQASIYIDGFNDMERQTVRRLIKHAGIAFRLIRGLRDESNALIRLCDALAGLLRDYEEGQPYAPPLVSGLQKRAIIQKL